MCRLYRCVSLIGFVCFILIGCTVSAAVDSAAVDPINYDAVITEEEEEARNNKQVKGNQGNKLYRVTDAESSGIEALENEHGLYQNWSDIEDSSRESTLDSETSEKRNRVMKASGEESCRLLGEDVDSSDSE